MKELCMKKDFWMNLLKIDDIPETLIIYGSWHYNKIFPLLDAHIIDRKETGLTNFYTGKNKHTDKNIAYTIVYGPTIAGEVAHGAGVIGIKKIILIGSCGALQPSQNRLLIPNECVRQESVSDWYLAKETIPVADKGLSKKAFEYFKKNGLVADTGKVLTISHMLMEGKNEIKKWQGENIQGVDLETATVYSIANYFQIKCLAILLKSEKLTEDEIQPLPSDERIIIRDIAISCAFHL